MVGCPWDMKSLKPNVELHDGQYHFPYQYHDFAVFATLFVYDLHYSFIVAVEMDIFIGHFNSKNFDSNKDWEIFQKSRANKFTSMHCSLQDISNSGF